MLKAPRHENVYMFSTDHVLKPTLKCLKTSMDETKLGSLRHLRDDNAYMFISTNQN